MKRSEGLQEIFAQILIPVSNSPDIQPVVMIIAMPATSLAKPWPPPRTMAAAYSGGLVSGPSALCREIRALAKALKQCFL